MYSRFVAFLSDGTPLLVLLCFGLRLLAARPGSQLRRWLRPKKAGQAESNSYR